MSYHTVSSRETFIFTFTLLLCLTSNEYYYYVNLLPSFSHQVVLHTTLLACIYSIKNVASLTDIVHQCFVVSWKLQARLHQWLCVYCNELACAMHVMAVWLCSNIFAVFTSVKFIHRMLMHTKYHVSPEQTGGEGECQVAVGLCWNTRTWYDNQL